MPLPLLIPVAVGFAGLYGGGKAAKAAIDSSDAKSINRSAKRIADESHQAVEDAKEKANASLEQLGAKKLDSLEKHMAEFLAAFSKLSQVETKAIDLGLAARVSVEEKSPSSIVDDCEFLVESGRGVLAGATGGSLSAFGAYSGTMLLASSSTGTAISTLSGAAATNATLAWLGGGTLASGGLGIAGGTMVLGTFVAGPALLVFGSVLGAKATKSLNDARSNLELAKTFREESALAETKLRGITEIATFALSVLSRVRTKLRRATKEMKAIQEQYGVEYSSYTERQQESVLIAVKYAQLLRVVVDTPLLDEEGQIVELSRFALEDVRSQLV